MTINNKGHFGCVYVWGGCHLVVLRGNSWLCIQGSFLVALRELYTALSVELRSVIYKANISPAMEI